MIILIQDSQNISSQTAANIKTVVKRVLSQLSSVSSDFKVAVATYATSQQISSFGTIAETISYMNNNYRYGGSGLNLLDLALSETVLKEFETRPDDRKTDTAQVSFTFRYDPIWFKLSKFKLLTTIMSVCFLN